MADRKAELERKKERLRQMREEKERRRRDKEKLDVNSAAQSLLPALHTVAAPESGSSSLIQHAETRASIDRALLDIGIAPVDLVLQTATQAAIGSGGGDGGGSQTAAAAAAQFPGMGRREASQAAPGLSLTMVAVQATNIPPKETVAYSKQTQTHESGPTDALTASRHEYYMMSYDDLDEQYEEDSIPGMGSGAGSPSALTFFGHKLPPGILPHGMPEVKDVKPALTQEDENDEQRRKSRKEDKPPAPELSEEEKQAIVLSQDFQSFFDRSTRLIERALCELEETNIFMDYTGGYGDEDGEGLSGDKGGGGRVCLNRWFFDEKWTKNRVITSMDWSTIYPELLLTSYDKNTESSHDPDGICLIWNTRYKKTTPEHVFHCQSQVLSATFARFHPNLILGGTYSGQIVLWDNRVGQKRTPVQRSPLSSKAHTHPVYCMRVVGTQNAHNLISISMDGHLCSWSLDMLSQPQETLELQYKQGRHVPVTSFAFPAGDVNSFIVGSEEGHVYTACRHGSRAGILDMFEGHLGAPVTGLSTHSGTGLIDFGDLFLTSSIDWTVKLWSLKNNRPLYSFEDNGDYIYDVAWSPTHPALFAAVDGNGKLDIWNLNSDTEVAAASVFVGSTPDYPASSGLALNRVSWTQSGLHVTVGDDMGKVWVYDVGESLSMPSPDEWAKFACTLADMKAHQSEQEDWDKLALGASS